MKYLLIAMVTIGLQSCMAFKQAPFFDELPYNTKGSYVEVYLKGAPNKTGELIEVNKSDLIILREFSTRNQIVILKKDSISSVHVVLSQTHSAKKFRRSSDIALMGIGHGWWMVFTLPINAIVISNANKTFRAKLPWSQLSKYARFPQGIPEEITFRHLEVR